LETEWSQRPRTSSRETWAVAESRPGVRAPIVAAKRGNARRAKGCRKVDAAWAGRRTVPVVQCLTWLDARDGPWPDGPGSSRRLGRSACGRPSPEGCSAGVPPPSPSLGCSPLPRPMSRSVHPLWGTHRLESRVREIRTHGSEGGEARQLAFPTPIHLPPASGLAKPYLHAIPSRLLSLGEFRQLAIRHCSGSATTLLPPSSMPQVSERTRSTPW